MATFNLKDLIEREDGILQVEEVVMEVVQKAGEIIYKHHMQRRVVPYAVQRAKADMLSIIEVNPYCLFISLLHTHFPIVIASLMEVFISYIPHHLHTFSY